MNGDWHLATGEEDQTKFVQPQRRKQDPLHQTGALPAAFEDWMPAGASSRTTHALGGIPSALEAAKNMSGAGLSSSNLSAEMMMSKSQVASNPAAFKFACTCVALAVLPCGWLDA